DARAVEDVARLGELVGGHVVAVGPDAEVRIVWELRAGRLEVVDVVRARRVAGLRDGDALVEWRRCARACEGELAEQPAVGHLVVHDYRVAVVVRRAYPAERREEAAQLEGSGERRARLVPDTHEQVGLLYVVIRADRAVGVGRRETAEARGDVLGASE